MAGDRLQHDLRRMEKSHLDQNTRELEITKHISLAQIDPVALLMIRQTGHCFISIPEEVYDEDHPGHYFRRIKSVSLSIPSVVGPYTGVNCRLSLERSEIRVSQEVSPRYTRVRDNGHGGSSDSRFVDVHADGVGSPRFALTRETTVMVTSSAQGDTGLFEQNLRDERYLPFEGTGAVSVWRLELPRETNRFDLETVSDVVMHVRYTARDGSTDLRDGAWNATFGADAPVRPEPAPQLPSAPGQRIRLFSARHDFPDAWHRFLHPTEAQLSPMLALDLSRERFPYYHPERKIELKRIAFAFVTDSEANAEGLVATLHFVPPDGGATIEATSSAGVFTSSQEFGSLAACDYTPADGSDLGHWQFRISAGSDGTNVSILESDEIDDSATRVRLVREKVADLFILCSYDLDE